MTNNMERMRFEIARAIITCFPKDYIEMAFVGGVSEKEFVDFGDMGRVFWKRTGKYQEAG